MVDRQMAMVLEVTQKDVPNQQLLEECRQLGVEYERICALLSSADRELLEQYISACENLEYRKLCLSMSFWAKAAK